MKKSILTLFCLFFAAICLHADPERTIIIANESLPASMEVARYYAEKRGIPEKNILTIKISGNPTTINWKDYVGKIYNPLMKQLVNNNWILASPRPEKDMVGRDLYTIVGHKIAYVVTVFGVPLRISKDEERIKEMKQQNVSNHIQTDAAAVDSELSILLIPSLANKVDPFGPMPNPLFRQLTPTPEVEGLVIRVGRLDGPNAQSAKALVDRAIEAEAHPLWGRAYVDVQGPHKEGSRWLRDVAKQLEQANWDVTVRTDTGTFKEGDRFDAPVFYFGWYTEHINGPFLDKNMRIPPGAVLFHLHSFSAVQLRNVNRNWVGGLVDRGATITFGNVYEPTLGLSHRPQMFLEALLSGKSAGFAAYYSHPALSWQGILIGDPLYCPNFGDVLKDPDASPEARGYAIVREMIALEKNHRRQDAIRLAEEFLQHTPHLPLARFLATVYQQRADTTPLAIPLLERVAIPENLSLHQAGLIREVALQLFRGKSYPASITLFRWLLENVEWNQKTKDAVIKEAKLVANMAKDQEALDYFSSQETPPATN